MLHAAQQPTTSNHIASSVLPAAQVARLPGRLSQEQHLCKQVLQRSLPMHLHSGQPLGTQLTASWTASHMQARAGKAASQSRMSNGRCPLSNCDGVGQWRQGVGWQSGVSHLGEAGGPVLLWTTSPTPTQAKRAVVLGHHKHKLCRSMCAVVLVLQRPSRSKPMPQPTTAALKGGKCRAGAAGCVTRTQRWYQPSTFLKS